MTDAQFKILIRVLYFGFTCLLLEPDPHTGSHRELRNAALEAINEYL